MTPPQPAAGPRLVLVTCADPGEAARISRALVEERLAACVSTLPGVRSCFRWQGRLSEETEHLLLIKTTADRFPALRERVRRLHGYEVPEIIALPLSEGDRDYLDWIAAATAPPENAGAAPGGRGRAADSGKDRK